MMFYYYHSQQAVTFIGFTIPSHVSLNAQRSRPVRIKNHILEFEELPALLPEIEDLIDNRIPGSHSKSDWEVIFESWIITNGRECKPNRCQESARIDNKLNFNFCCRLLTKTSYLGLRQIGRIYVA